MGACFSDTPAPGSAYAPSDDPSQPSSGSAAAAGEVAASASAASASAGEPLQLKEAWTDIKKGSVWKYYEKVKTLGEGMTGAVYQLQHKGTRDTWVHFTVPPCMHAFCVGMRTEWGTFFSGIINLEIALRQIRRQIRFQSLATTKRSEYASCLFTTCR